MILSFCILFSKIVQLLIYLWKCPLSLTSTTLSCGSLIIRLPRGVRKSSSCVLRCSHVSKAIGCWANASLISSYHHPGKDRAHTLCEFTTPYQCVHPPHSKPWQHAPPLARRTKAAMRTQTSSYLQLFIGAYVCKAPKQWLQKPHSESIQQSKHQVPHYWQTRQISFEKEYKQSSMPSPIPN